MLAQAAEVDQFTGRFDPPPADSSAEINRRFNEFLQVAVDEANDFEKRRWVRAGQKGRERRLYKEMRKHFNNHIKSDFMMRLIEGSENCEGIEVRRISKADSVFADWSYGDGIVIAGRRADNNPLALSPLIRMGEVSIGVDKFEHIFERGWRCFENKYQKGVSVSRVIYLSASNEKVFFGGNRFATGVFSYADLVANFNGMRFWNDVLQKHDDILGERENAGPYVLWVDGAWKVNPAKPIDLKHYIDWGMDEGINCSRYASRGGARKVRRALLALSESDPDHDYTCPMDIEKFNEVSKKYGKYSERILNHEGIRRRGLFFDR